MLNKPLQPLGEDELIYPADDDLLCESLFRPAPRFEKSADGCSTLFQGKVSFRSMVQGWGMDLRSCCWNAVIRGIAYYVAENRAGSVIAASQVL